MRRGSLAGRVDARVHHAGRVVIELSALYVLWLLGLRRGVGARLPQDRAVAR
ncbi:MAG: hypothetical protein RR499_02090 [Mucinivorans sp.]